MRNIALREYEALRRTTPVSDMRLLPPPGCALENGPPHAPVGRIDFEAELPDEEFFAAALPGLLHPALWARYCDPANRLKPGEKLLGVQAVLGRTVEGALELLRQLGLVTAAAPSRWWRAVFEQYRLAGQLQVDGTIRRGPKPLSNEIIFAPPSKRQQQERALLMGTIHEEIAARNAAHARAATKLQKDLKAAQSAAG